MAAAKHTLPDWRPTIEPLDEWRPLDDNCAGCDSKFHAIGFGPCYLWDMQRRDCYDSVDEFALKLAENYFQSLFWSGKWVGLIYTRDDVFLFARGLPSRPFDHQKVIAAITQIASE